MLRSAQNLIHPATVQLLRFQSRATASRVFSSFLNPQRRWLAIFATLLGCVWLSQVVISIFFRQSADPANLFRWISTSLLAYTVWHVVKTVVKTDFVPFEWTPAEDLMVRTAPVTRSQLVSYRLLAIFNAAVVKALFFAILLSPDLTFVINGFLGMLIGLMFVDLTRVCFEILFDGLENRTRFWLKSTVLALFLAWIVQTLLLAFARPQYGPEIPGGLFFLKSLLAQLIHFGSTTVGSVLITPFEVFTNIILTERLNWDYLFHLTIAVLLTTAVAISIYQVDRWAQKANKGKQERQYDQVAGRCQASSRHADQCSATHSKRGPEDSGVRSNCLAAIVECLAFSRDACGKSRDTSVALLHSDVTTQLGVLDAC